MFPSKSYSHHPVYHRDLTRVLLNSDAVGAVQSGWGVINGRLSQGQYEHGLPFKRPIGLGVIRIIGSGIVIGITHLTTILFFCLHIYNCVSHSFCIERNTSMTCKFKIILLVIEKVRFILLFDFDLKLKSP